MSKSKKTEKISDSEWKIMHFLWEKNRASANETVEAVCPENDWTPQTVRTLLTRLVDKGILKVEKERGKEKEHLNCVYTPLYSRKQCVRVHGESFLQRVFAGNTSELLVHFVQEGDLTPEQIKKLRRLLEELPDD